MSAPILQKVICYLHLCKDNRLDFCCTSTHSCIDNSSLDNSSLAIIYRNFVAFPQKVEGRGSHSILRVNAWLGESLFIGTSDHGGVNLGSFIPMTRWSIIIIMEVVTHVRSHLDSISSARLLLLFIITCPVTSDCTREIKTWNQTIQTLQSTAK